MIFSHETIGRTESSLIILLIIIAIIVFCYYRKQKKEKILQETYYDLLDKRRKENQRWANQGYYIGETHMVDNGKIRRLQRADFYKMSGVEFEKYCMDLLSALGYKDVKETSVTGDYGVDILATKRGKRYGFQCKCYSYPVGIKAVQEIASGIQFYNCDKAVVITNSTFTKAAENLSVSTNVELWDKQIINRYVKTLKSKAEPVNHYTVQQKLVARLVVALHKRINELQ